MKFLNVCTQVSIASTVYYSSLNEKEWLLGTDHLPASMEQFAIAHVALKQLSICFESLGWKFLSSKQWGVLSFSPVLIAAAHAYIPPESPEWQKRISSLIFHSGNVGRVLVVTSTVALGLMGKKGHVAVSLATYGICWIEAHDQTSDESKKLISLAFHVLSVGAGVCEAEGYIDYFFSGLELLGFVDKYLAPYIYGQYEETDWIENSEMSFEELQVINPNRFKVHPDHFHPPSSNYGKLPDSYKSFIAEMEQLGEALEKVDWAPHISLLLMKIQCDDHWTNIEYVNALTQKRYQEYRNTSILSKELEADLIDYLQEGLRILIYRMKKKAASFAGVESDLPPLEFLVRKTYSSDIGSVSKEGFEKMQRLISPIVELLKKDSTSAKSVGISLALGIDGANFCGTRLSDLFDILFKELFEKRLDAAAITYNILREKQLEYLYKLMERETAKYPKFYRLTVGEHTPHRKNLYLKFYGESIGLNIEATDNDSTTSSFMGSSRLFWIWWVRRAKREFYTEHYTPEHLVTWVQEQAKTGQRLSWKKLECWFKEHGLRGHEVCTDSGELKEEAIRFFLLKLGALGISATPN